MYGGRIMETSPTRPLFAHAEHPYTHALFDAYPSLDGPKRELIGLPGHPPDLSNPPPGCRFAPRCPMAQDVCASIEPDLVALGPGHRSRCHFAGQVESRLGSRREEAWNAE
jgi:peptide/nickel transport system ATP-binding protein